MTNVLNRRFPTAKHDSHDALNGALSIGTIVYTLDGALPVEYLGEGDRIVTRSGAKVLRELAGNAEDGFTLRFDAPEIVYADGLQVAVA